MNRIKQFFISTIIGGLLVILPVALFLFIMNWVFGIVRAAIAPLTNVLLERTAMPEIVADAIVVVTLILLCFVVGMVLRTRIGKWIYSLLETKLLKKAPGYGIIKETVAQFIGNKKSPFSATALVQIFGNDTMVSAFITDEHSDGSFTVFVPTGPNPTSGNIYHLPARLVTKLDAPADEMMRSIISCGAGSSALLKRL
ncbi:MAG: DUF502 domain-containing protein [Verrucomicrobiaceae bacterium]|nr:DUF502 domain-containing protein [Verrucomicrobiaceae bacterium]